MPPTFKKPLEYDPSMANKTLALAEAQTSKKKHMLVELGLADEALALDDDDDEEDDEDMESPILTNGRDKQGSSGAGGGGAHGSAGGTLPNYGYKDVFGKEYEKRRRQLIELKGYDKYVAELLAQATESLQTLRADRGIQSPGSAEVISELQHELGSLTAENKALRVQDPKALSSVPGLYSGSAGGGAQLSSQTQQQQQQLQQRLRRLEEEVSLVNEENDRLRRLLQGTADDDERQAQSTIKKLIAQTLEQQLSITDKDAQIAELMQAGGGGGGGGGGGASSAQVAELQAEIKRLSAAAAAAGSAGAAKQTAAAAGQSRRVEELESELQEVREQAQQLQEELEGQAQQFQAQLKQQEAGFSGKLAQMAATSADQEQAAVLQQQLWSLQESSGQQIAEYERRVAEQEQLLATLKARSDEAAQQVAGMSTRVAQAKTEAATEVRDKLAAIYGQVDALHKLREELLGELLAMQKEVFNDAMMTQMGRLMRDREISAVMKLRGEAKEQLTAAQQAQMEAEGQIEIVRKEAAERLRIATLESEGLVRHYAEKWRTEFERRKKLHNIVAELKGSIRVLCRVRPLVEKERAGAGGAGGDDLPVRFIDEETVRVTGDKAEKDFEFDRVFGVDAGQEQIYDEVSGLVTSVLDGYNVCIMAYGQTGSGKTFTMEGPDSNPGVYNRALTDLFRLANERSDQMDYTFMASTLEIYNEQIYDLLSSSKEQDDKLDVKQGSEGMYVPGLIQEQVASIGEVVDVIHRGKKNRSTFSTNMNEHSSRSHLVLSVHLTATTKATGVTLRGKLHLVDLAGSERLSRTGAQGDRLKEAQAINKSLSALGDVIQALQQRNSHIPYRNSKLTRLLEDSLGGNSKTVMVVHVSPAAENTGESKCSLEFASRARKVELGKARQNIDTDSPKGSGPSGGTGSPVSRLVDNRGSATTRTGSPSESTTSNSSTPARNVAGLRKPAGR